MKKFFKFIGILILIAILVVGIGLFIFRHELSLLVNVSKKYKSFLEKGYSTEELLNPNSVESMDYRNIEYKNTNGVQLTLDIYGPKKELKGGSPVILYVHGGSWVYGDKEIPKIISPILDAFREEGYTIISTSYQLMRGEEIFNKQISDVKDTIRWIHKNKDKYGLDEKNIGVIGVSSGAHLALMACYTDNSMFIDDEQLRDYSSSVKYIVDFFGPTDLRTLELQQAGWDLKQVIDSVHENKERILEKYSPINYVNENEPSTLIIHSKKDGIVPYDNSTKLHDKLNSKGNDVELLTLEGASHDFSQINIDEITPIGLNMLKFISKNMR